MEQIEIIYSKLDDILKLTSLQSTFGSIRDNSKYDLEETKSLIRKLRKDDFITVYRLEGKEVMPKDDEFGWDHRHRMLRSAEGDLFLLEGGYLGKYRKEQTESRKKTFRTGFDIVIAAATLLLGYFSFRQADKIDKLTEENKELVKRVDSLSAAQPK